MSEKQFALLIGVVYIAPHINRWVSLFVGLSYLSVNIATEFSK